MGKRAFRRCLDDITMMKARAALRLGKERLGLKPKSFMFMTLPPRSMEKQIVMASNPIAMDFSSQGSCLLFSFGSVPGVVYSALPVYARVDSQNLYHSALAAQWSNS